MWFGSIHKIVDIMLGTDIHDLIPPVVPPPPPTPAPSVEVFSLLGLGVPGLIKMEPTVLTHSFPVIQHGSDIGPMIPHVSIPPANILTPIHMLASGSKSEFGAFTVMAKNKPLAVAFPLIIIGKLNLNCQGPTTPPLPLPTANVMSPGLNFAGIKLGDIIASYAGMFLDMAIGFVIGKIAGLGGSAISALASKALAKCTSQAIVVQFLKSKPFMELIGGVATTLFGTGSPTGWAAPWNAYGASGAGDAAGSIPESIAGSINEASTPIDSTVDSFIDDSAQGIMDYFNDPGIEQF